jgi:hypothetical protein
MAVLRACLAAFLEGVGARVGPEQLIKMASGQLPDAYGMSVLLAGGCSRQRQTSDSRLGDDAHGYGLPECLRHVVKFTSGGATFRPDRLGEGIDSNTLHEG